MEKAEEYFNQRISCNVEECRYFDSEKAKCALGEILVDGEKVKENTFCDSFEEK